MSDQRVVARQSAQGVGRGVALQAVVARCGDLDQVVQRSAVPGRAIGEPDQLDCGPDADRIVRGEELGDGHTVSRAVDRQHQRVVGPPCRDVAGHDAGLELQHAIGCPVRGDVVLAIAPTEAEDIAAVTAMQHVITRSTIERVITIAARQGVVSCLA